MKESPNEAATTANFEFDALHEAENYRRALIRDFGPFLKGRVIEVGSGIGQVTSLLRSLNTIEDLQAVEPDPDFCAQFRRTQPTQSLVEGTIEDLPVKEDWNAILSINVLEHIREDEAELRRYSELLREKKGVLNLFVPARQEIYAPLDKDFGHHRR